MTGGGRKKVLIVDDDETVLMVSRRQVMNAGFDVETASGGKQALEKVRAEMPDLVVVDAMMPDMSGIETCRQIRATAGGEGVPIILLTPLKAGPESPRESGATEILRKPVKGEDLIRSILTYLRSPAQRT